MNTVLEVRDLSVTLGGGRRPPLPVVRGVGFTLRRGEVLGLVGESGAGKTLTALSLLGLAPDGARVDGSVRLLGEELVGLPVRELAGIRGRRIAMIFQDPLHALTPVRRIGDQIAEALRIHQRPRPRRESALRRAVELLDFVGVPEPARAAGAYPHQLSGGLRQRAVIAMAMANGPDVLVADEPTSALDVTVQAQVLGALADARRETGAALLLVSHDLGVIAGAADRVAVMYAGRIVETGPVEAVFARPRMPYTLGLIGSVPRVDARVAPTPVPGTAPPAGVVGPGCAFASRCPLAEPECETAEPRLLGVDSPSRAGLHGVDAHEAACLRARVVARRTAAELFPPSTGRGRPSGGQLGPASRPATFPLHPPRPTGRLLGTSLDVGPLSGPSPDVGSSSHRSLGAGPTPGSPFATGSLPGDPGTVVLRVSGLAKSYTAVSSWRRGARIVRAVEEVDLEVRRGETLALVGESGAGKSTVLMEIASLHAPQAGTVEVLGQDTGALSRHLLRRLRGAVQIVPQDPMSSLDPRMPVGDIVAEPLLARRTPRALIDTRVPRLLRQVGLDPADAAGYPHQFSGGQRQRIAIARALAVEPALLLLDEPVSALDVSVQAGILDLLLRLKQELGPAYLVVSHDLAVVRQIADRVCVMYAGRTVESGTVAEVFDGPRHPYTRALLSAVPLPDPPVERARRRIGLPGEPPSGAPRTTGCRFLARCPVAGALPPGERRRCASEIPAQLPTAHLGTQTVACHFPHGDSWTWHDRRTFGQPKPPEHPPVRDQT
ncbi:dipeptide ABC transporter ATP-binding protein [Streptomyces sp. NPDC088350]|uniref:dipeptide ABC transporter ATP-binding protein n=1 Tax=Streptomyces sp. NPDC088350 TaxID=3365854 RepID=UPI00381385D2